MIFKPNLPKKGISDQKQKKWTSPLNSAYSNWTSYQILPFNWQFWHFGPNLPKKGIPDQKTENVNITIEFYISKYV